MSEDKVWVVTFDGWLEDNFGSFVYLLGVYETEGKAFSAAQKLINEHGISEEHIDIQPVVLDNTFDVSVCHIGLETEAFLGGYAE